MIGFLGSNISNLFILPTTNLIDSMAVLDKGTKGVVLVVNDNQELLGIATDGDFRRALINKKDLNTPVSSFMNTGYKFCKEEDKDTKALKLLNKYQIEHLPIINNKNQIVDLAIFTDLVRAKKTPETAVIMAGGLGTRLYPLTKETPKPMLNVADKPLLEWIIAGLKSHGVSNIILAIRNHDSIQKHFKNGEDHGVSITYLNETEVKGTAGALSLLEQQDKPFIVMNGDILTNINYFQLYNTHITNNSMLTVVSHRHETKIAYGVLQLEGNNIVGLDEKPSHYHQINAGIYVLSPDALKYIPKAGEFTMPELIRMLIEEQHKVTTFPLLEFWLDIGQHKDYQYAQTAVLDFLQ